ncbi:MAG: Ig-like domain repeat protein [Methanosphaera sp.]|nr:Ig-like domain repeat protein [Methanosphaera sp.]
MRINKKIFIVLLSIVLIASLGILSANDLNDTDTTTSTITKHTTSSNPTIEKTRQTKDTVKINNETNSKKYINKDSNNYEKKAFKNLVKNNNKTLKEYKDGYTVTVDSKTDYEGYVKISASVKNYFGYPVDGGFVDFFSDGRTLGYTRVSNGIASINTKLTAGTYQIIASYSGSQNQGTGIYTIKKGSSSSYYDDYGYTQYTPKYEITFPDQTVYIGKDCTFYINIKYGNEKVQGGIVDFQLSGNTIGRVNVKNGVASIKYTFLKEGYEILRATYYPDMYNTYGGIAIANARINIYNNDDYYYNTKTPTKTTVNTSTTGNEIPSSKISITYNEKTYKNNTPKTPTKITINKIKTVEFSDKIMITGTYKTSKGTPLKNTVITLNINGKQYKTKTYSSGNYFYKYQTNKVGTNTITATFPGNNKYKAASTKTTFKVTKKGTRIKLNYIPTTAYSDKVIIKGKFTNNKAKALKSATIILKINGKKYATKTDTRGEFTYKYQTNKVGTNTVTAYFKGNDYYKYNSTNKTFTTTKKKTTLTINNIPNTYYTDTVEISGKLLANDKLNGKSITLKINGNTVTRKTNKDGIYTYEYKTKIPGKNNITATFKGDNYYQMAKTSKTFKVTRMPTTLYMDNYSIATIGKKETITGELYNNNNDPLKNTKINIYYNGAKKTVKTNKKGYFSYTFTAKKAGKNKLTAQYIGTNKYIGSKKSITVDINKMSTYTSLYQSVYDKTNKIIYISGAVYDEQNNYLKKAPVTININRKYYKTTTDNYGYFYYQAKPTKTGTNTITITYPENNKFLSSSFQTTIDIPIVKATKITMDSISKTTIGNYVDITGQFTDNNYNALKNINIVLTINGKNYNTKTDEYGYYYYSYKTTKTGTNKVTATFKGNTNYKASSTTKTFTVTNYNTVELYTHLLTGPYPEDSKRVGDDIFTAWYQLTDRQNEKGVHIFVEDYYANDMGDPPHNLIVDATFYFKNNAGKIITKKFETGNGGHMYHSLVSGYTPYKVVAEYRKMTSAEKNKWNNGYGYNPKTKKWFSYY